MESPILAPLLVGLAAVLLGSGGFVKSIDSTAFRRSLEQIAPLRSSTSFLIAVVPPLEILVSVLLIVAEPIRLVLIAAAMMFAAFSVVSAVGPSGPCGCGPFVPARRGTRMWLTSATSVLLLILSYSDLVIARELRFLGAGVVAIILLTVGSWNALIVGLREFEDNQGALSAHGQ